MGRILRLGSAGARSGFSDLGYDVAVAHLDQPAPVGQFAQPPAGGLLASLALKGQTFNTLGYERTKADATKGPNNIQPNFDPDVRNVAVGEFRNLRAAALTVSQNPATGDDRTWYGDSPCRATGRNYRLDIPFARQFLASQGEPVP